MTLYMYIWHHSFFSLEFENYFQFVFRKNDKKEIYLS